MGQAAQISPTSDVVEEPAANSVAFRPSARKILGEIERGTRLEQGALLIRKIIQFHPFGDRSASDPDLGGDVSESPAGGVQPLAFTNNASREWRR